MAGSCCPAPTSGPSRSQKTSCYSLNERSIEVSVSELHPNTISTFFIAFPPLCTFRARRLISSARHSPNATDRRFHPFNHHHGCSRQQRSKRSCPAVRRAAQHLMRRTRRSISISNALFLQEARYSWAREAVKHTGPRPGTGALWGRSSAPGRYVSGRFGVSGGRRPRAGGWSPSPQQTDDVPHSSADRRLHAPAPSTRAGCNP